MARRVTKPLYFTLTICWFAYCWIGTAVGVSYHSDWPVAPQIWQGIGIALIPAVLGYLILFHGFQWLREFFRERSWF